MSGRITPTNPLPAAVTLDKELITEKLASKDEMLSPAGTTAGDVVAVEVPPHAIRAIPESTSTGTSLLGNFI
ncbi:MAG TPA: hypothetical protein VFD88_12775 [Clostridia bacterium]|nr:hypothetical protein [Clostridia bacterium]